MHNSVDFAKKVIMKINTMCLIESLVQNAHLTPLGKGEVLGKKVGMILVGKEEGYPSRCVFEEVCGESSEIDFYNVAFTYEGSRITVVLDSYLDIVELNTVNYLNTEKLKEIGMHEDLILNEEQAFELRKNQLEAKVRSWLPVL